MYLFVYLCERINSRNSRKQTQKLIYKNIDQGLFIKLEAIEVCVRLSKIL